MAFPQVVSRIQGNNNSTTTNHFVNIPAAFVDGQLLMIYIILDGNPTITDWDDCTELKRIEAPSAAATLFVGYLHATGSVSPQLLVSSQAQQSCYVTHKIDDHRISVTPEVSTGATGTTIYPNSDELVAAAGAEDILWIAFHGNDYPRLTTQYPFFDNRNTLTSPGGGGVGLGISTDELNQSSVDPAEARIQASEEWAAITIAIRPALMQYDITADAGNYILTGSDVDMTYYPNPHEGKFRSKPASSYRASNKSDILRVEKKTE